MENKTEHRMETGMMQRGSGMACYDTLVLYLMANTRDYKIRKDIKRVVWINCEVKLALSLLYPPSGFGPPSLKCGPTDGNFKAFGSSTSTRPSTAV